MHIYVIVMLQLNIELYKQLLLSVFFLFLELLTNGIGV